MKTGCQLLTEYNDNLKFCESYPPLYKLQLLSETFVAAIHLTNIRPSYQTWKTTNELIIKLNQFYKDTMERDYFFPRREFRKPK